VHKISVFDDRTHILSLNFLSNSSSGTSVDLQAGRVADLLDQTLSLQIQESLASARTVDLQAVDEDGGGDELVGGNLLDHLGVGLLVHDGGVVGLLLGLTLRPLLLLSFADVERLQRVTAY